MTKKEVAEFLRVEPSTVYELTRKRGRHPLAFRRVGKYLRFSRTEVERWWNEAVLVGPPGLEPGTCGL